MNLWRRIFSERKRVLLPLAVALIANVGVLLLVVVPLRTVIGVTEGRALDATRDLAEARRQERQVDQARQRKAQADEELSRFYTQVLPRDARTAETTTNRWLAQAAQGAGLSFKGSHFEWDDVRDSSLSRASARITLEGSYADIRRFLEEIESAEEFIIVERVELADSGSQPGAAGRLQV